MGVPKDRCQRVNCIPANLYDRLKHVSSKIKKKKTLCVCVCVCIVIHLISGVVNILLHSYSVHQRCKKM
jgi:flagellar basal body-associated protein FliL